MIDFHTHILPNMDDGASNVEESISLLNILENEGVDTVCLTPHFYGENEDIDSFLKRRQEAYDSLINEYKGNIKLIKGSEVRYYHGICNSEEINKLCIENTKLLLLELPFNEQITDSMINEVVKLSKNKDLKIILAHIERYELSDELIKNLKNLGILIQANTSSFLGYFKGKQARNRLKNNLIDLIGSDAHNSLKRPPKYKEAMDYLYTKIDKEILEVFIRRADSLVDY